MNKKFLGFLAVLNKLQELQDKKISATIDSTATKMFDDVGEYLKQPRTNTNDKKTVTTVRELLSQGFGVRELEKSLLNKQLSRKLNTYHVDSIAKDALNDVADFKFNNVGIASFGVNDFSDSLLNRAVVLFADNYELGDMALADIGMNGDAIKYLIEKSEKNNSNDFEQLRIGTRLLKFVSEFENECQKHTVAGSLNTFKAKPLSSSLFFIADFMLSNLQPYIDGAFDKITRKSINKMLEQLHTDPERILSSIKGYEELSQNERKFVNLLIKETYASVGFVIKLIDHLMETEQGRAKLGVIKGILEKLVQDKALTQQSIKKILDAVPTEITAKLLKETGWGIIPAKVVSNSVVNGIASRVISEIIAAKLGNEPVFGVARIVVQKELRQDAFRIRDLLKKAFDKEIEIKEIDTIRSKLELILKKYSESDELLKKEVVDSLNVVVDAMKSCGDVILLKAKITLETMLVGIEEGISSEELWKEYAKCTKEISEYIDEHNELWSNSKLISIEKKFTGVLSKCDKIFDEIISSNEVFEIATDGILDLCAEKSMEKNNGKNEETKDEKADEFEVDRFEADKKGKEIPEKATKIGHILDVFEISQDKHPITRQLHSVPLTLFGVEHINMAMLHAIKLMRENRKTNYIFGKSLFMLDLQREKLISNILDIENLMPTDCKTEVQKINFLVNLKEFVKEYSEEARAASKFRRIPEGSISKFTYGELLKTPETVLSKIQTFNQFNPETKKNMIFMYKSIGKMLEETFELSGELLKNLHKVDSEGKDTYNVGKSIEMVRSLAGRLTDKRASDLVQLNVALADIVFKEVTQLPKKNINDIIDTINVQIKNAENVGWYKKIITAFGKASIAALKTPGIFIGLGATKIPGIGLSLMGNIYVNQVLDEAIKYEMVKHSKNEENKKANENNLKEIKGIEGTKESKELKHEFADYLLFIESVDERLVNFINNVSNRAVSVYKDNLNDFVAGKNVSDTITVAELMKRYIIKGEEITHVAEKLGFVDVMSEIKIRKVNGWKFVSAMLDDKEFAALLTKTPLSTMGIPKTVNAFTKSQIIREIPGIAKIKVVSDSKNELKRLSIEREKKYKEIYQTAEEFEKLCKVDGKISIKPLIEMTQSSEKCISKLGLVEKFSGKNGKLIAHMMVAQSARVLEALSKEGGYIENLVEAISKKDANVCKNLMKFAVKGYPEVKKIMPETIEFIDNTELLPMIRRINEKIRPESGRYKTIAEFVVCEMIVKPIKLLAFEGLKELKSESVKDKDEENKNLVKIVKPQIQTLKNTPVLGMSMLGN